jgi:molybdopterin/thiamine biosynthesis adenylyltransferase
MAVESSNERFRRQIPILGEEGQEKIGKTRLLIAGAGGLGSTAALFSAMAGFGTIRIIDPDYIEETNLNRQLLYHEIDIGRLKAETAAKAIRAMNSSIEVESDTTAIGTRPARDLIRGIDVVIDGLDNYPARYLLADAAWRCGIPFIHGAVDGFYGQVFTIVRPTSPFLHCIVPTPPPVRETPVIGVTTGITGCVQVIEAIKLATGTGNTISDQLWLWDGIRQKSDRLKIDRIQTCHICGQDSIGYQQEKVCDEGPCEGICNVP